MARAATSSVIWSPFFTSRSAEHTSELQLPCNLVCCLLLEKKNERRQVPSLHPPVEPKAQGPCVVGRRPLLAHQPTDRLVYVPPCCSSLSVWICSLCDLSRL